MRSAVATVTTAVLATATAAALGGAVAMAEPESNGIRGEVSTTQTEFAGASFPAGTVIHWTFDVPARAVSPGLHSVLVDIDLSQSLRFCPLSDGVSYGAPFSVEVTDAVKHTVIGDSDGYMAGAERGTNLFGLPVWINTEADAAIFTVTMSFCTTSGELAADGTNFWLEAGYSVNARGTQIATGQKSGSLTVEDPGAPPVDPPGPTGSLGSLGSLVQSSL